MQLIGGARVLKVMQARWVYVIVLALIAGALLAVYVGFPRHPAGPTRGVPTVGVVGQDPSAMAIAPALHRVFVLNYGDGTVSMIDTRHPRPMRTLAVGGTPYPVGYGLVVAQRMAHVFVVNGGNAVRMLDARSGRLLRTTYLRTTLSFLAVDERTGRVFVSETNNFRGNGVSVLDARTGALVRRVTVGQGAGALAVDERSGHVFVQKVGETTVSMLDARSGVLLRTITLGAGPSILAQARTTGGPLPTSVVVDEHTGRAFVTGFGAVHVLDTRTGALLRTTRVGHIPSAGAVDVRTNRVFVANLQEGTVTVLDARTGRTLRAVRVGRRPWALAVARITGRVCVANADDNTVSVLDARSGRVLRTVPVGLGPTAMAVDASMARVYVANKLADHRPRLAAVGQSEWQLEWQRLVQVLPFGSHPPSGPITGSVSAVSVAH